MYCSLKAGLSVPGSDETIIKNRLIGYFGVSPSIVNLQFAHSKSREFMGKPIQFSDQRFVSNRNAKASRHTPINAQASIFISRGIQWWEKTIMPNMIEIHSAQELVGSLLNAGDRLVIIDFYSPGCGAAKHCILRSVNWLNQTRMQFFLRLIMKNLGPCAIVCTFMSCPSLDSIEVQRANCVVSAVLMQLSRNSRMH